MMFQYILRNLERGRPFTRDEFRLLDWSQREFIHGNFKAFGWRYGLRFNLTLLSPLANTILNYSVRHLRLAFADAETGQELDPLRTNAIMCKLSKGKQNDDRE